MGGGPVGTRVPVRERGRGDPGLERVFVVPPGDDEPLEPPVGRPQQLETLEAFLPVDRAGAGREAPRELVSGVLGHGDGVDLDDGHTHDLPRASFLPASASNGPRDAGGSRTFPIPRPT